MMKYFTNQLLFISIILFFGCDNWIEGYDSDPNSSPEVNIDNLFTASQVNVFSFSENHLARSIAIWMQQMAGTDRQYKTLGLYSFEENEYATSWHSVYINGGLKDLRNIQSMADDEGPKGARYKGIAQIMEAYLIGSAASVWGDIPYSEVLNESIENPKLDDQALVYSSVQNLLDEAINNLESDTTLLPQNDMFFNGDIEKWTSVAYTLKARYYMHWVEIDESNCEDALINAELGISSLGGTMKTLHGIESSEQNLWYQFYFDRTDYMVAGYNLVKLLRDNNDPRLNIYFGENEGGFISGASPNPEEEEGAGVGGKSYLNDKYFGADASIDIVSYEENLLIKAECLFLQDDTEGARGALEEAKIAAVEKWGFSSDTTFSDMSLSGLDNIIEEKYIALFLNKEIWNDYKRNCYPNVNYKKSVDDDGIPIYEYPPVRVYYPEDERITNTSIPNIIDQPLNNDNDPNECPTL